MPCQSSCNDKSLSGLSIVVAFSLQRGKADALYNSILTLTAFFSRIQTIDLTVKPRDCFKAIMLCFFEVTTLRFIMAFVRLTAFIGYKKKKLDWGRIEIKKMNI